MRSSAEIHLWGPFRVVLQDGTDATPRGKRARAMLALLIMAPGYVRSRVWLQDKLWIERSPSQGAASLRQELSSLRKQLAGFGLDILIADRETVRLAQNSVQLIERPANGELLEGFDLADAEFEDWLRQERASRAAGWTAPVAPDKTMMRPTLVVRRFRTAQDDPQTADFAEGLAEELITVLGVLSGAFRIKSLDADIAPHETAYVLEGQVRRTDRIRVTCRLLSDDDETCLWTGRFDLAPDDNIFAAQENIARQVCEAAQVTLTDGEWSRIWSGAPISQPAWEQYQLGRVQEAMGRRLAMRKAQEHYQAALDLDPGFHQARVSLAFCLMDELRLGWAADPAAQRRRIDAVHQEIDADKRDDPFVQALEAYILLARGDRVGADARFRNVALATPNSPELLAYHAVLLGLLGRLREEIQLLESALDMARHPPTWIFVNLGFAHFTLGDLNAADQAVTRALAEDETNVRARIVKIAVLHAQSRFDEARAVASELRRLDPYLRSETWRSPEFSTSDAQYRAFADALKAAGLP